MEKQTIVRLHGYLGQHPVIFANEENLSTRLETANYAGLDDECFEKFSDGSIELKRRAMVAGDDLYKIECEWTNVSDTEQTGHPLLRPQSVDRYVELNVPSVDGKNLAVLPEYGKIPPRHKPEEFKYPALTISSSYMQTIAVFTDDKTAEGFITRDWECMALHWVVFPEKTFKPKESFKATIYLAYTAPSEDRPGAEAMLKIVERTLNK